MSKKIVVLGASGFIGRQLVESLAADNQKVIAATRRAATFANPRIENVSAPFDAPEHFLPLLAGADFFIHTASVSTPGSTAGRPLLELAGNLRATLALLEALQHFSACKLIFLSSGGTVYGDRSTQTTQENALLQPRSYHGAAKVAAEQFIHAWAMQSAATGIIIRPSNVYGPGQTMRNGFGIIPAAFNCASTGDPIKLWGDGSAVRDYLYIADLVELVRLVLANPPRSFQIMNASNGIGISLKNLLDVIDQVVGHPLTRIFESARRVDIQSIVPDKVAATAAYGWEPTVSLEAGLYKTWKWYRANC